jgi:5-aminopentanamidase
MRVASIQVKANDLRDYQEAWEHLEKNMLEAAKNHDLILVPECAFPSYFIHPEEGTLDERLFSNGKAYLNRVKEIARMESVYIAYGYVEKEGESTYNSALLIDRNGNEVVKKRKSFLWHFDSEWFTEGEDVAVADTEFGRVALVVCADARMPETVRLAALEGAVLIIDLANLTATGHDMEALQNAQSAYMLSVRALENQVWLAVSDKWGVETNTITYAGRSAVYAPDGTCMYQAGSHKDEIVSVEIPTDENGKIIRSSTKYNLKRRPELYEVLVAENGSLPITKILEESVVPSRITPYITVAAGDFHNREEYLQIVRRLVNQGSGIVCMPPTPIDVSNFASQIQQYLPESSVVIATVQRENNQMTSYFITKKGIEDTYVTLHHSSTTTEIGSPLVFQTKWGRIGIMHDLEALLPEWSRALMLLGADCIVWPNSLSHTLTSNIGRTRAAESRVFIVSANSVDKEGQGVSQIIDPNGVISASTLKNERVHACGTLTPFTLSRIKEVVPGTNVVKNRRPQFYRGLVN